MDWLCLRTARGPCGRSNYRPIASKLGRGAAARPPRAARAATLRASRRAAARFITPKRLMLHNFTYRHRLSREFLLKITNFHND